MNFARQAESPMATTIREMGGVLKSAAAIPSTQSTPPPDTRPIELHKLNAEVQRRRSIIQSILHEGGFDAFANNSILMEGEARGLARSIDLYPTQPPPAFPSAPPEPCDPSDQSDTSTTKEED
jgi:hypothetical protein